MLILNGQLWRIIFKMFNMWGDQGVDEGTTQSPDQALSRQDLNKKYPKPLVAIDRDGVINSYKDVIKTPAQFEPIAGSLEAISIIRRKGYKVAIIFDQPNISQNLLTVDDVDSVTSYMMDLFGKAGCQSIDGLLYNMSSLKEDVFAKPNVGMFKRLRDELKVPIKGGYYVGDRLVDAKMADKAKLKPILVKTGQYHQDHQKFNSFANRSLKKKTRVFENLLDFAKSLP